MIVMKNKNASAEITLTMIDRSDGHFSTGVTLGNAVDKDEVFTVTEFSYCLVVLLRSPSMYSKDTEEQFT